MHYLFPFTVDICLFTSGHDLLIGRFFTRTHTTTHSRCCRLPLIRLVTDVDYVLRGYVPGFAGYGRLLCGLYRTVTPAVRCVLHTHIHHRTLPARMRFRVWCDLSLPWDYGCSWLLTHITTVQLPFYRSHATTTFRYTLYTVAPPLFTHVLPFTGVAGALPRRCTHLSHTAPHVHLRSLCCSFCLYAHNIRRVVTRCLVNFVLTHY